MSKEFEGYVIGKDFNTKDWFVYEDATDSYLNYFDTEKEAEDWLKEKIKRDRVRRPKTVEEKIKEQHEYEQRQPYMKAFKRKAYGCK